jgi:DNA-binding protein HU-beta
MVTKVDIIRNISDVTGLKRKEVKAVLDAFGNLSLDTLKVEGQALLPALGKLKLRERNERRGRNPRTGEPLTIPAKKVVRFSASRSLKLD